MDKLKKILDALLACEKEAQAIVDGGEHFMMPVLRSLQSAIVTTRQRVNNLEAWDTELKQREAQAKADTKANQPEAAAVEAPEKSKAKAKA